MADQKDWPIKAYKDLEFLTSTDAREIRVLCEFMEPGGRFRRLKVRNTVVFFGSTHALPRDRAEKNLRRAEAECEDRGENDETREALGRATRAMEMSQYYEDARELARRLTEWSQSLTGNGNRFAICSGGGPGIMEAANRGASEAGGPSIGLNISLAEAQPHNAYQTRDLSFEFHYFFIRKFWFVYLAAALVVFPGGFGTLDELFEVLTLVQTGKARKRIPVLVYGSDYWKRLVNFEVMVDAGTIAPEDMELFRFCDDVDTAFEFLKTQLTRHFLQPAQTPHGG